MCVCVCITLLNSPYLSSVHSCFSVPSISISISSSASLLVMAVIFQEAAWKSKRTSLTTRYCILPSTQLGSSKKNEYACTFILIPICQSVYPSICLPAIENKQNQLGFTRPSIACRQQIGSNCNRQIPLGREFHNVGDITKKVYPWVDIWLPSEDEKTENKATEENCNCHGVSYRSYWSSSSSEMGMVLKITVNWTKKPMESWCRLSKIKMIHSLLPSPVNILATVCCTNYSFWTIVKSSLILIF